MTALLATVGRALWSRARNLENPSGLTPELVELWLAERGTSYRSVLLREVGTFAPTLSVVVSLDDGGICLPVVPSSGNERWRARREAHARRAELWSKMEWFEPPWLPRGDVQKMLDDAKLRTKKEAVEAFDYHTSTLYTVPFQAVCVAQLMPQCRCLKEFVPLVREAFLGFFSGSRASAIAALIPVVEGALTRIADGAGGATWATPDKVNHAVDAAIAREVALYYEGMWVPREFACVEYLLPLDERVQIFDTLRRWLLDSFFRKTGEYDGATWLNRHLFAHGASSSWQQAANFRRLIVAIATIGWVEAWGSGTDEVTLFFPEMNDDGHLLWQHALFQADAQGILKAIAERRYHEQGRLVPELPTDDGSLLRRALLSEDCIKDLVRPLRDAGWSVEVGEPEEDGLFVVVRASAGGAHLGVALLYSCATANDTYRALAADVDVILYRGAPYHQASYAYGLDVHVGPVAAWQPPRAPA